MSIMLRGSLAAAAAMLALAPAHAVTISSSTYNFVGVCADCAYANGVLTLSDASRTISTANFVSFAYTSNLISFTISNGDKGYTASGMLANLPGPDTVTLTNQSYYFQSSSNGGWSVGRVVLTQTATETETLIDYDNGPTHAFSTPGAAVGGVPEPASWAMMIAGFGMIGGTMRRRAAKVAFA